MTAAGEDTDAVLAERARFRHAMGRFVTGVTVLTTRAGNLDHAMTANAVASVSLDPLMALACIEVDARFHDAVLDSGVWSINVLPVDARPTASWLATRGRPLYGQLERVPFHRGPDTGVALLDQALSSIECRTHDVHAGGDHIILVGNVTNIELGPDDAEALVFWRGTYARLA